MNRDPSDLAAKYRIPWRFAMRWTGFEKAPAGGRMALEEALRRANRFPKASIMTATGQGRRERFPSTHWSLVARSVQDDTAASRAALGDLLQRYLPALRAHLGYKQLTPEEADDLLQEFVAGRILEKDLIARANRNLGKFRTFLLTALNRFLVDQIRASRAKKRAPDEAKLVRLGERAEQLQAEPEQSDAFDVAWARGVLDEALRRMQTECESSGRADVWGVFQCRVLDPILSGTKATDYDKLIRRFGLTSPSQASNVLMTAKRMYARALRSVVAEYARDGQEIAEEIEQLRKILSSSSS